jgi:hypothetical protein
MIAVNSMLIIAEKFLLSPLLCILRLIIDTERVSLKEKGLHVFDWFVSILILVGLSCFWSLPAQVLTKLLSIMRIQKLIEIVIKILEENLWHLNKSLFLSALREKIFYLILIKIDFRFFYLAISS